MTEGNVPSQRGRKLILHHRPESVGIHYEWQNHNDDYHHCGSHGDPLDPGPFHASSSRKQSARWNCTAVRSIASLQGRRVPTRINRDRNGDNRLAKWAEGMARWQAAPEGSG